MKNTALLLCCSLMLAGLVACGGTEETAVPEPTAGAAAGSGPCRGGRARGRRRGGRDLRTCSRVLYGVRRGAARGGADRCAGRLPGPRADRGSGRSGGAGVHRGDRRLPAVADRDEHRDPGGLRAVTIRAALVVSVALLGACGGDEAAETGRGAAPVPSSVPAPSSAPAPSPSPSPSSLSAPTSSSPSPSAASAPGASAATDETDCARARACCPVYARARPATPRGRDAEDPCATLELAIAEGGAASGDACRGALDGFRRALSGSGRATPSACR
jgi:hypothetical protein